jgi:hypothetical protein
MAARSQEIMMPVHGHPTVVGLPISRAGEAKGWSQQLHAWWATHRAVCHTATLASLSTRWDATREAVTPFRADAAPVMAAAHGARSVALLLYSLAL